MTQESPSKFFPTALGISGRVPRRTTTIGMVSVLAGRRVEMTVITFGNGGVRVYQQPFITANEFVAPILTAGGNTPMGAAINWALDMLQARKALYKENGVAYYRPWVFMITDGAPTDSWQQAAERIRREEQSKSLSFFAVGLANANMEILEEIAVRKPLKLQCLKFSELFLWLSHNLKNGCGAWARRNPEVTELTETYGWAELDDGMGSWDRL